MIYETVSIDDKKIVLCADEDELRAEIKVWVNNELISLPIIYDGEFTIHLTEAGLAALESCEAFRHEDIKKVEFDANDGSLDDSATYI